MLEHRVQNWHVRKPLARSRGGVVATQNRVAGEVGARVLAAGGNAVDAAVTTGFALVAVEPWNCGLGGIGFMLVYQAKERRVSVVDFGPVSPRGLDPAAYPLAGGGATARDLFNWPGVKDDRNVHGPLSFAVPGHVDGLGLALEKFGTLKLADAVKPAIELAERGIAVDWFLTLKIATAAKELARYGTTREVWLRDGLPPVTPPGAMLERLHLNGLAGTLKQLSSAGRRDFYEGGIAAAIVKDVKAMGGSLDEADLRNYRARMVEPLVTDYRGVQIVVAPGLTAGPSMVRALDGLRPLRFRRNGPHADAFLAYAQVLREAYSHRLSTMGETADRRDPSSTTHLSVIDRQGNMVALTQTLLSVFGSKVVLPSTGILMNNGIMWFDPRPGTPNGIAPGKRPLTNMCPAMAFRATRPWFAIGASGGRKIFPAVLQISSFLIDHGMYLEDAFHQPRLDASEGEFVAIDSRMPAPIRKALSGKFPTRLNELVVYPTNYACPSAVLRDSKSRENFGATDVMSPWSGAVSEEDVGPPARGATSRSSTMGH
jgi:gamma-glutamyltranspeptidase / glutathione hydrolase